MPGEHCAGCGTVRTPGGCACTPVPYGRPGYQPVHPDLEETAILPHTEGPQLVRPYVPAAAEYEEPHPDEFPTALLPPVPATDQQATALLPPVPAPDAQATTLLPPVPAPDAQATTLLPPVPPQQYASIPAQQPYQQQPYQHQPHQQQSYQHQQQPHQQQPQQHRPTPPYRPRSDASELGVFAFEPGKGPGGRAERRAGRQATPVKRKAGMAAAGVGIVAIGAGIALALVPGAGKNGNDQAGPVPVGSLQPMPTSAVPSAPPTTAAPSESPSPSPSKSSPRPTLSLSRPPVIAKATTTKPSPSPTVTKASPSASPTPSGPRTLGPGMTGPDVAALQQQLATCGYHVRSNGSYDGPTAKAVRNFQWDANVQGDPSGVYGPNTQAALADAYC
ncbi:peptidoglycan-binding protein [Kitasatospora sp. HPMI-4]|uniref:peptidoglycan-binding domain-containing protein n=1 Tax=Kitasatospora sp. HPMI-4 TaxID=3448443 RepID=UPI003F1D0FC6